MWRIIRYFAGTCRLTVSGASTQWALNALSENRIAFFDILHKDEFTLCFSVYRRELPAVRKAVEHAMCQIDGEECFGFAVTFAGICKRPLLPVLLLAASLAAFAMTQFVFFYEVQGNDAVPSQKILRELRSLGVGFGVYGPDIHPQQIKNQMLRRIFELQWLTVRQSGCKAVVVVRERPEIYPIIDRKAPHNVIASSSGVVTKCDVLSGNALCRVGDAVKSGELLVSAYTDLGYKTQVSSASAEIYALTRHRLRVVCPDDVQQKRSLGKKRHHAALVVGEKRINIFGNSRISDRNCDKIIKEYPITLPGKNVLPITIEITELTDYDTERTKYESALPRLTETAEIYLKNSMIAGKILHYRQVLSQKNGVFVLDYTAQCEEMIARTVDAELFKDALTND